MGNKQRYYEFKKSDGTLEVMSLSAAKYSKDPLVHEQIKKIKEELKCLEKGSILSRYQTERPG